MHRDLVTVVIPRGFRLIQREMLRQGEDSRKRHEEHCDLMKSLNKAIEHSEKINAKRPKGTSKAALKEASKPNVKSRRKATNKKG